MRYKFYDVASYLRSKGGIVTDGSSTDVSLFTELHQAATDNQKDKVQSILSQGVDVNIGDADGRTGALTLLQRGFFFFKIFLRPLLTLIFFFFLRFSFAHCCWTRKR